jgi:hypothetical protein
MDEVSDCKGEPLIEGDRVEAWRDGKRYTATVKTIAPHRPGDGDFRLVILVREDDHTEVQSFSDAVVTLPDSDPLRETAYLTSSPLNARHLLAAIDEMEAGGN